jgi:hypothetical protein
VVDADSQHFLWTALRWAAAALHQIERVRDSWEQFQAVRKSWLNKGTIRVTPEMERPASIFWSDMQFLMIAVRHLQFTLEKLGRGAPLLDKTLSKKAVELRQLLEHWWEADPARKHWKKYRERLGEHAMPTDIAYEPGDPIELRFGSDPLSITELEADIRRVEGELIDRCAHRLPVGPGSTSAARGRPGIGRRSRRRTVPRPPRGGRLW